MRKQLIRPSRKILAQWLLPSELGSGRLGICREHSSRNTSVVVMWSYAYSAAYEFITLDISVEVEFAASKLTHHVGTQLFWSQAIERMEVALITPLILTTITTYSKNASGMHPPPHFLNNGRSLRPHSSFCRHQTSTTHRSISGNEGVWRVPCDESRRFNWISSTQ